MYNNNIRTDSEIHKFINSEFRNDRLRLEWPLVRAVLMGTKSCPKILNFSTRFSFENLDVEDFVTLLMGKKSC